MGKAGRARGGTIAGVTQTQTRETLLRGQFLTIRDGRIEFGDGSGGLPDTVLQRSSAGVLSLTGVARLEGAVSDTDVFTARVIGDSQPQFLVNANGKLEWGSGGDPVDVNLFRDGSVRLHTVNTFATEGDLVCDVTGGGLNIKEGSNARMGTATLTAGEATVATTEVTANSRIFLTSQVDGGTPGWLRVSDRTAGQDFTITSSDASDTSTVAWLIVEPAS